MFFFFNRVTDTLTYSGLTLTATSLAGNRFLNFFFLDFGRIYFIHSGMHHASQSEFLQKSRKLHIHVRSNAKRPIK